MQAVPLAPSHNVAEEAIDNESEIALFFFIFFPLAFWDSNAVCLHFWNM